MSKFTWWLYSSFYIAFLSEWGCVLLILNEIGKTTFWIGILISTLVYLILIILTDRVVCRSKNKFFQLLQKNNFVIDTKYQHENTIICIDFTNNKLACNELSLEPIKNFEFIKLCTLHITENGIFNLKNIIFTIGVEIEGENCELFNICYRKQINKKFKDIDDFLANSERKNGIEVENILELKKHIDRIIKINESLNYPHLKTLILKTTDHFTNVYTTKYK